MLDLEKVKTQIENGELSYEEFVKLINSDDEISLEDFFELMTDNLAEQIDVSDFKILENFVDNVSANIEKRFNSDSYEDYIYQPKEDGGIFSKQLILTNPELGIIGEFMNITTCACIRIDFRPSVYMYVEIVLINEEDKSWVLGENKYLHFEVCSDGDISEIPSLESF